jgi:O-antigen/teichoic acid export membrane protein
VRVLVGTIAMIRFGPLGLLRPRWGWARVRPILGFGLRFQGIGVVAAFRDQGLNAGIAAVASISVLGLWSLAYRIMQVPFLLVGTLWRISYPTMSRLLGADQDPRPVIERGIGIVAVALSPIVVGIAAGAHALLPPLVGERWSSVSDILVWASLAMTIGGPISIPSVGFLLASGEAGTVLRYASAGAVTWLAIALPLLPLIGVTAIGLGWLAMAVVEATLLGRRIASGTGARVLASLARPLAVAVAAGSAGYVIAALGHRGIAMGLAGVVAAELILLAGLLCLAGEPLRATLRLGGLAVAAERTA